jgi:hypothetical protein
MNRISRARLCVIGAITTTLIVTTSPGANPPYRVQVLPDPGQSVWHSLNDRGICVGYTMAGLGWPTTSVAVAHDLASPSAPARRLGLLNAGANINLSVAYRIDHENRIIGWSRNSSNRDQPVRFAYDGSGLFTLGTYANHTYTAGQGAEATRVLIESAPGAYILNTASQATAISPQLAGSYLDSMAMNASGQVVAVTQYYSPDRKETRWSYLRPDGTLTSGVIAALSSAVNPYAITIRAMNNRQVIIGETASGGLFYGYAYDRLHDAFYLVGAGGYTLRALNENNDLVGARSGRAVLANLVASNLTITSSYLDDLLAPEHAGWALNDAVAINQHGVILAKGGNAGLGYSGATYVLLKPSDFVDPDDPTAVTTHPDAPPIPHSWLAFYGLTNALNPTFNEAVTNDADGDGFKAWEEYIAGTDPTSPASRFTVDLLREGETPPDTCPITWPPITGRWVRVETAPHPDATWTLLPPAYDAALGGAAIPLPAASGALRLTIERAD